MDRQEYATSRSSLRSRIGPVAKIPETYTLMLFNATFKSIHAIQSFDPLCFGSMFTSFNVGILRYVLRGC